MFGAGRGRSTRIADTVQVGAERDGKSVEERGGGIGKGRQTEDWRPTARCVRPLRGGSVQCTVANIDEPFQIQCEHTHKAKKKGGRRRRVPFTAVLLLLLLLLLIFLVAKSPKCWVGRSYYTIQPRCHASPYFYFLHHRLIFLLSLL